VKPCKTKEIGGKRYRCFFELTLRVIGGKWKPIILYQLAREGIMRFSHLRREIPEVTERMLSKQLRSWNKTVSFTGKSTNKCRRRSSIP
jgi:DNA-binding HxlR family transcriptional regulator